MKNKLKNLKIGFLLILFTFVMVMFPKFYFSFYDQKKYQTYQIENLNLKKVSESTKISNEEKLKILLTGNIQAFSIHQTMKEEEYNNINKIINQELNKISSDCAKIFQENFQVNYQELNDLEFEQIYLSNPESEFLSAQFVSFVSEKSEVNVLLDLTEQTILYFYGINFSDIKYKKDEISEYNLQDKYANYLQVTPQNFYVAAYANLYEISLRVTNQEVDSQEVEKSINLLQ